MKMLLGDFKAKVGRNDIFKPTVRKQCLHKMNNNNGARVVNSVISKNLSRLQCSHIATIINTLRLLPIRNMTFKYSGCLIF